jgi:ubiquinone/menaquinone biosynthesis C-methylase UbiE
MSQGSILEERPGYLTPEEGVFGRTTPTIHGVLEALAPQPDDLVADISAGSGQFTLALARYLGHSKGRGVVFGCDISKEKIDTIDRRAKSFGVSQHLYPVHLDELTPFNLPFYDEQIDGILSVDRVHLALNPLPFLRDFARVLKPCGTLVIAQSAVHLTFDSPGKVSRLTKPEDLYPLLREAGLDVYVSLDLDSYLWVVRAMKPIVVFS